MMQNKHIVTQKFCVTERKFEKGVKEQVIILVGPNKRDIAERQCLFFVREHKQIKNKLYLKNI